MGRRLLIIGFLILNAMLALWPSTSEAVGTSFTNQCTSVSWNANNESDLSGYRLYDRPSTTSTTLAIATMPSTVLSRTCVSLNFAAGQHYLSLTAFDTSGNESTKSTEVPFLIVQANVMNDLAVESVTATSVTLGWTEVDGGLGSPASYDVRFAPVPITWGSAPSVTSGTCTTPVTGTTIGAHKSCTVTGLTTGLAYQFQATPLNGPQSNIVTAIPVTVGAGDTTPPSQVTGMSVAVIDSSHLTVTSAVATDNVAVTAYLTERCQGAGCTTFAQVANSASTTFADANLLASTTYCYRRRAQDATPNFGVYSATVCGTTSAGSVTLPVVTGNIPSLTGTTLTFTGAPDEIRIQTDFGSLPPYPIASFPGGVLTRTWRQGETFECAFARIGGVENTAPTDYLCQSLTGLIAPDVTAPVIVNGKPTTTLAFGTTSTTLSWQATDVTGPAMCKVHSTDQAYGSATNLLGTATSNNGSDFTFTVSGLTNNSSTPFYARCQDALTPTPNVNASSTVMTVVVAAAPGDVTAPTTIANLACTVTGPTAMSCTFTPATDAVGVVGNEVALCQGLNCATFTIAATWANTSPQVVTGLVPATPYSLKMRAFDAAGNRAVYSNVVTLTTAALTNVVPPGPLVLQALDPILYNAITLVWPVAQENTAIASSTIERCEGDGCTNFQILSTTSMNVLTDHTVKPLTVYQYRGKFKNTSGVVSADYIVSSFVTPDIPADTMQGVCPCRNNLH